MKLIERMQEHMRAGKSHLITDQHIQKLILAYQSSWTRLNHLEIENSQLKKMLGHMEISGRVKRQLR